jgi:hypothetical protein
MKFENFPSIITIFINILILLYFIIDNIIPFIFTLTNWFLFSQTIFINKILKRNYESDIQKILLLEGIFYLKKKVILDEPYNHKNYL